MAVAPPMAQCRFCLEEAPVSTLISPCQCEGTGRYVHLECLTHWQQTVASDQRSAICQVCRTEFSPQPKTPVRVSSRSRGSLFSELRTNPHYDRHVLRNLSAPMRTRLLQVASQPGCLVLQTPGRAASQAGVMTASVRQADPQRRETPRHSRWSHLSLSLHEDGMRHRDGNLMALFEAVLIARSSHWHKGVYLIGGVWPSQANDGSDTLIGVNLVGHTLQPGAMMARDPILSILEVRLRRHAVEVPIIFLHGGPVRPDRPLVLVVFRGELSDHPLTPLVRLVNFNSNSTREGDEAQATACIGALFGEPIDINGALERHPRLVPVAALIFQGHAVWSSTQLMCEVARGSWGLTAAVAEDITTRVEAASRNGDQIESFPAAENIDLWSRLWEERDVISVSSCMQSGTQSLRTSESRKTAATGCTGCVVS